MTKHARTWTGLGTTLLALASLLAGCGTHGTPTGVAARAGVLGARAAHTRWYQPNTARPIVRPMKSLQAPGMRAEDDSPSGDTPAPAPAPSDSGNDGGLTPLPQPTATPAPKKAGGDDGQPDDIDQFLYYLQMFGYNGDRKHLIDAVHQVVYQYPINDPVNSPMGWDPDEYKVSMDHYNWWKGTFDQGEMQSYDDYMKQSLMVAQNRTNVVYYVWVSKQRDPQAVQQAHQTSPWVDFNQELPIVKGIADGGWMVNISPNGTILDYLCMPAKFLYPRVDFNHLIPIPRELYY